MFGIDAFKPSWYAVHAKPRQERRAVEHLSNQGFVCFLPEALNPRRLLPNERSRIEAVFPRYLFVHHQTADQSLATIRSTRGVSSLVGFGSVAMPVAEWIIAGLKSAVDPSSGLIRLEALAIAEGDCVEIYQGPFAGLKAIVEACDGKGRVEVLLELLGRPQRVAIDRTALRTPR